MGWCLCTGIWIYFEGLFWPWLYTSSLRDLAYRLFQPFWVRDVPILVLWMMIGQVIHLSHTSLESLGGELPISRTSSIRGTKNAKSGQLPAEWPFANMCSVIESCLPNDLQPCLSLSEMNSLEMAEIKIPPVARSALPHSVLTVEVSSFKSMINDYWCPNPMYQWNLQS